MKHNHFLQRIMLAFASVIFLFGSLFITSQTVEAKELTNVTFKTKLQNEAREEINLQALRVNGVYEFFTEFDLTAYDNNLANGDYFTFDLPEPFDVIGKTEEFFFDGIAVADVAITSNGTDKGGQVKLTLKNLDEWMKKKQYTSVQGVKGNFSGKFTFNSETERTVPLQGFDATNMVSIKVLPAIPKQEYDGTVFNYRKMAGLTAKKDWTSEALGRSGNSVHYWYLRINENGKSYNSFVLTDTLQSDGFQFIPESFRVYQVPKGRWTASGIDIKNTKELSKGEIADLVKFNDSYTSFTVNFGKLDGEGYYFLYDTTTTNDGTILTNGVQATEEGLLVKPFTNRENETASQSRESTVQGTITMKGRVDEVTIYKRDGITHRGLNGVTFEIVDKATNEVLHSGTTAKNDATGNNGYLRFGGLTVGHTYIIRETATLPGYDMSKEPFEFTIEPNAKEGITKYWDNYRTPVSATITARKTLENRDLANEEFTFELVDAAGKVVSTAKNDASGLVTFEQQTFKKEGSFVYKVREKSGEASDITYDKTEKTATVKVIATDKGLVAEVEYEGSQPLTFKNIYNKPAPARIVVKAHKSLDGKALVANQFSFTLTDKATNRVYSAQNAADGSVSFEELTFDKEGKFEFELAEVKGDLPGIVYDETTVAVTIEVTKEGNQLKAQVTTPNEPDENAAVYTFKNKYQAKSTTAQLSVTKVLTGRELKADEFSFTLTNAEGEDLETVKNTDTGVVAFSTLTYVTPGEFTYTIKENKGEVAGVTYDEKTIEATVKVVDDGQGQLKVEQITYKNGDNTFNNSYTTAPAKATIQVAKSLTGRALTAGEFSFTLTDESSKEIETVTNDGDGNVTFGELTFDKVGKYTYKVKEVKGTDSEITYDSKELTITITVTDNGQGQLVAVVDYPAEKQFVNEYVTTTTTTTTASTTSSTTESTTTTTESTTPSTTESTTTTTESTTASTTESTTTTTESTTPSTTESTTTTTESTTASTTESTTTTTESTTPSTTESTTTTTESTTPSMTESTTTTTESTTPSTTESTTTTTESTTPSTTESTTTTTESTTPSTTESTTTTTEGTTMTTVSTSGGVTTTNVTPKGGSSRRRVALPSTGEANGILFIVLGTIVLAAVGYGLKRHRR